MEEAHLLKKMTPRRKELATKVKKKAATKAGK
jgi:hypothetical protein